MLVLPDFAAADTWVALLTLMLMEIVLGIDNIVFLSILTSRLPEAQQPRARSIGLGLALGMRILLLLAIKWVMGLTATLFTVLGEAISGRDLILGIGGLFLLTKATREIYLKMEVGEDGHEPAGARASMAAVLIQIILLDIVFSLDSVITAVGMADNIVIMIIAMIVAVTVMLVSASGISNFINRYPSMKVLALSFLILIGVLLMAEAFDQHVNKGYIYFAMAFALVIEIVNIRMRKNTKPVAKPAESGAA
ncbi:TerC family protein [Haliangium ochraceum]|uniref:Integral membrane protein TerC n=1 Tax=Haliangium ochraceum (strain DSM 14365 / JCM 11303 / SMP-2) TaxID=502025 RepID=D0LU34_HALO1|nr:Integral membrane protein TerC [Haliangium ochraceum DSM 14365]